MRSGIWEPSLTHLSGSRMLSFMRQQGIASVGELNLKSIAEPEWYWRAVPAHLDIQWYKPYEYVYDRDRAHSNWYIGARCNFAHNALEKHAALFPSRLALISEDVEGQIQSFTYGELNRIVNRLASALTGLGIRADDVVALFLPVLAERITTLLACAKLGAVCLPVLIPGCDYQTLAQHLIRAEARALITTDWCFVDGKQLATKSICDRVSVAPPSLEFIVTIRYSGRGVSWLDGRDIWWDELLQSGSDDFPTRQVESAHPLLLEGALGADMPLIQHTHGGFPIKAAHDLAYIFNVTQEDVVFWCKSPQRIWDDLSATGVLLLGGTLLISDHRGLGIDTSARLHRIWETVERHRVSVLCLEPSLVETRDLDPKVLNRQSASIRVIASLERPWNAHQWHWLSEHVVWEDCPVISTYGNSLMGGIILGCTLITSIKAGACNGPVPGIQAVILDELGNLAGETGRLAVHPNWPGADAAYEGSRRLRGYVPLLDQVSIDAEGFWYVWDA